MRPGNACRPGRPCHRISSLRRTLGARLKRRQASTSRYRRRRKEGRPPRMSPTKMTELPSGFCYSLFCDLSLVVSFGLHDVLKAKPSRKSGPKDRTVWRSAKSRRAATYENAQDKCPELYPAGAHSKGASPFIARRLDDSGIVRRVSAIRSSEGTFSDENAGDALESSNFLPQRLVTLVGGRDQGTGAGWPGRRQRSVCCSSGTSSCQGASSPAAVIRAGAMGGHVSGRPLFVCGSGYRRIARSVWVSVNTKEPPSAAPCCARVR
jgi:hypothetical protein